MSKVRLRDYQIEAHNLTFAALKNHESALLVIPTGGGKNTLAAFWAAICNKNKKHLYFIVDGTELVTSFIDRCKEQFNIEVNTVQGNLNYNPNLYIHACSMATIRNRNLPKPDLVIIDEAHGTANNSYTTIFNMFEKTSKIGITATPFRADNKPLSAFEYIVHPKKSRMIELINRGYLVDFKFIRCIKNISSDGLLKKYDGEYNDNEVEKLLYEKVPISEVYKAWIDNAKDKITMITSTSIKRSKDILSEFQSNNIPSAHINGSMNHHKEVIPILEKVKNGEIKVLCVNNKGLKGLDIPSLECLIIDRLFGSYTNYLQFCGRGSRPFTFENNYKKKECIIIDCGDNVINHGLPKHYDLTDFELTTLEKKDNKEKEPRLKNCPECGHYTSISTKICKNCGYSWRTTTFNIDSTNITFEVLDDELFVLERISKIKKQKESTCRKYLTKGTVLIYALLKSKGNINKAMRNAAYVYSFLDKKLLESIRTQQSTKLLPTDPEFDKLVNKELFSQTKHLLVIAAMYEGRYELLIKIKNQLGIQ